jgi:hypothetical protein
VRSCAHSLIAMLMDVKMEEVREILAERFLIFESASVRADMNCLKIFTVSIPNAARLSRDEARPIASAIPVLDRGVSGEDWHLRDILDSHGTLAWAPLRRNGRKIG